MLRLNIAILSIFAVASVADARDIKTAIPHVFAGTDSGEDLPGVRGYKDVRKVEDANRLANDHICPTEHGVGYKAYGTRLHSQFGRNYVWVTICIKD